MSFVGQVSNSFYPPLDSMIPRILTLYSVQNTISVSLLMVTTCMLPAFGTKCLATRIWIYLLSRNYWLSIDATRFQMYSRLYKISHVRSKKRKKNHSTNIIIGRFRSIQRANCPIQITNSRKESNYS